MCTRYLHARLNERTLKKKTRKGFDNRGTTLKFEAKRILRLEPQLAFDLTTLSRLKSDERGSERERGQQCIFLVRERRQLYCNTHSFCSLSLLKRCSPQLNFYPTENLVNDIHCSHSLYVIAV